MTQATVRTWRQRSSVHDESHTAHPLQTTVSPEQEHLVVLLRKDDRLPLDDRVAVTQGHIHPQVSRPGIDRCLRRHGVSSLKDCVTPEHTGVDAQKKSFKAYDPGFIHASNIFLKYKEKRSDAMPSSRSTGPRAGFTLRCTQRKQHDQPHSS